MKIIIVTASPDKTHQTTFCASCCALAVSSKPTLVYYKEVRIEVPYLFAANEWSKNLLRTLIMTMTDLLKSSNF